MVDIARVRRESLRWSLLVALNNQSSSGGNRQKIQ